MTDIIDLARAAGVPLLSYSEEYLSGLERLVAAAVAAECEACAKVCDEFESEADPDAGFVLAAAIRARGNA